jgi:hypothetical protein
MRARGYASKVLIMVCHLFLVGANQNCPGTTRTFPLQRTNALPFFQEYKCYPGPDHFATEFDARVYEDRLGHRTTDEATPRFRLHVRGILRRRAPPELTKAAGSWWTHYVECLRLTSITGNARRLT